MTILLLETIDPDAQELLSRVDETVLSSRPDRVDECIDLDRVVAIVTRGLGQVNRSLLDACPNLRVVARCGAGLDNIDTDHLRSSGIPIVFAPGLNAGAVAEHTLMLILMIRRQGFRAACEVRGDNWSVRNTLGCDDIRGSTLGILGYGRVGRKVAELAAAFGMSVRIYDPDQPDSSTDDSVASLLPQCDVVTLHLPLTDETANLMDQSRIGLMREGAILINTSRGEVVDSEAVVDALNRGRLSGYGADVAAVEPPEDGDRLIHHERAIVTPHMASLTRSTYRDLCVYTARNVVSVLTNQAPMAESLLR